MIDGSVIMNVTVDVIVTETVIVKEIATMKAGTADDLKIDGV